MFPFTKIGCAFQREGLNFNQVQGQILLMDPFSPVITRRKATCMKLVMDPPAYVHLFPR